MSVAILAQVSVRSNGNMGDSDFDIVADDCCDFDVVDEAASSNAAPKRRRRIVQPLEVAATGLNMAFIIVNGGKLVETDIVDEVWA